MYGSQRSCSSFLIFTGSYVPKAVPVHCFLRNTSSAYLTWRNSYITIVGSFSSPYYFCDSPCMLTEFQQFACQYDVYFTLNKWTTYSTTISCKTIVASTHSFLWLFLKHAYTSGSYCTAFNINRRIPRNLKCLPKWLWNIFHKCWIRTLKVVFLNYFMMTYQTCMLFSMLK